VVAGRDARRRIRLMRDPNAAASRLRVAVVLDSLVAPAWVAAAVKHLVDSDLVELRLVLVAGHERGRLVSRLWAERRQLLFLAYERLDRRLFRTEPDAFAPVDLSRLLASTPTIAAPSGLEGEAAAALESADLDVIAPLGSDGMLREALPHARYGVWAYDQRGGRSARGGPPHFWELDRAAPTAGSTLLIFRDDPDAGRVVYRSQAATNRVSLFRSRNPAYWKSAAFLGRRLADLDRHGFGFIESLETYREEASPEPPSRVPTNLEMVGFLLRLAGRLVRSSWWRVNRRQWLLGYRPHGAGDSAWTVVTPPRDRFFADPFFVERDAEDAVFFEDYRYRRGSAIISCAVLDSHGRLSEPRPALERPYHLSYPFVFELGRETYMLPETLGAGQVELYRCTRFPDRWELEDVLLPVAGVDPTLLVHAGKLWLFLCVAEPGARAADELCLFSADSLAGPWVPHPRNPVVSDVRRARPAGRVFARAGALIRPAQDMSTPAFGVVLNRIEVLTETDYRERPIGYVELPFRGVHTYSEDGRYDVVDFQRRLFGRGGR
jgi:hypothetical protein